MTCAEFREMSIDTAGGAQHAAACEPCARFHENQRRIKQGLAMLGKNESRVPSAAIEAALLSQLKPATRPLRWKVPAALAAAIAAGFAWFFLTTQPTPGVPTVAHVTPAISAPQEIAAPVIATVRKPRHKRRPRPVAVVAQREAPAAEFLQVPFSAPLGRNEQAQMVRVAMPAATLSSWGFPLVPGDPARVINADVVVGENGLARAVRLVR